MTLEPMLRELFDFGGVTEDGTAYDGVRLESPAAEPPAVAPSPFRARVKSLTLEDVSAHERARRVDLLVLPQGVKGTSCSNCGYQQDGHCRNERVNLDVRPGWCCDYWDHDGAVRPWEGEVGYKAMTPSEQARATTAGLVVLPPDVVKQGGTRCGNCLHFDDTRQFCDAPRVRLPVTERMACAAWGHPGVKSVTGEE